MALAKLHPCFGWLHLSGEHYRICFNKLIQMRDEQIAKGTYNSGIPEGYEEWAYGHLKEFENYNKICLKSIFINGRSNHKTKRWYR